MVKSYSKTRRYPRFTDFLEAKCCFGGSSHRWSPLLSLTHVALLAVLPETPTLLLPPSGSCREWWDLPWASLSSDWAIPVPSSAPLRTVLQMLHIFDALFWTCSQVLHVFLAVRCPKLNTVHEMQSHQCQAQRDDHLLLLLTALLLMFGVGFCLVGFFWPHLNRGQHFVFYRLEVSMPNPCILLPSLVDSLPFCSTNRTFWYHMLTSAVCKWKKALMCLLMKEVTLVC